jgi:hypothetical protein
MPLLFGELHTSFSYGKLAFADAVLTSKLETSG